MSLNRFLYAEANPTTLVDPTGRMLNCLIWADDQCVQHRENAEQKADRVAANQAADEDIEQAYTENKRGGAATPPNWTPPSVDAWVAMSSDDQNAYTLKFGEQAQEWLDENAFTDAILESPTAFYVADWYLNLTNFKKYVKHGGLSLGDYVTGDQALSYAGLPDAGAPALMLVIGFAGQFVGGMTDSNIPNPGGGRTRGMGIEGFGPTSYHGESGSGGGLSLSPLAKQTLAEVEVVGGPLPRYGSHRFQNVGRPGDFEFPRVDSAGSPITYMAHYVKPGRAGKTSSERLLFGSDGSVWYTTGHYREGTVIRIQ